MPITEDQIEEASVHVQSAIRKLEMLQWFIDNRKKLKFDVRAMPYFERITSDLARIQSVLFTDDEYTKYVAKGLARVNHTREYDYQVTADNQGNVHYSVNALLPLREMKENVIFAWKPCNG
jgi:hypothetical protein